MYQILHLWTRITDLYIVFLWLLTNFKMAFTRSQRFASPVLYHCKAISASYHQGDDRFPETSRGQQCCCNALLALCVGSSKPPQSWQTADLNTILQNGDHLYNSLAHSGPLLVSQLPNTVTVNQQCYNVDLSDSITGPFEGTCTASDLYHNLLDGLKKCFSIQPLAFFVCRGYTIALLKSGQDYALVDSHSRNKQGIADSDGTAVTFMYRSWTSLYNGILQLLNSLGIRGQEPYELVPARITSVSTMTTN